MYNKRWKRTDIGVKLLLYIQCIANTILFSDALYFFVGNQRMHAREITVFNNEGRVTHPPRLKAESAHAHTAREQQTWTQFAGGTSGNARSL